MKHAVGIFLVAVLFITGCGGSGTKKRESEVPGLPSLKPGPIITVATGSDDLAPDLRYPPAVALLGVSPEAKTTGDTIIVWTTGKTLQGAMYSGSTTKLSSMTLTSTPESDRLHLAPSVVAEKDGTFTVIWDNGNIVGQKFGGDGNPLGTLEVFSKTGAEPDVVLGKDGKIFISYIGNDRKIHLITKTKNQEKKDIVVGEDLTGKVGDKDKQLYFLPNIGVDDAGNILVVWQETPEARGSMAEAPNGYPNFATRIDPAGKVAEKDIRIDKAPPSRIGDFPAVFGLSSGWAVAWKDTNANEKTFGDGSGLRKDATELMKQVDSKLMLTFYNAKGEPTSPSVRVDTSGKVFTSPGIIQMENISQRTWRAALPGMARDRSGNIFVAWTDYRSGKPEVYGRLVNGTATQMGPEMKLGDGLNPQMSFDGKGFQAIWEAATVTPPLKAIYLRDLAIEP